MKYVNYYCTKYFPELEAELTRLKIRFNVSPKKQPYKLISFYVPYTTILTEECSRWITNKKPLLFVEYTQEERDRANYLTILPNRLKVELYNPLDSLELPCNQPHCGLYIKQTKPFVLNKEPKWSKTAFYARDTGYGELFVDERIKTLVEQHDFYGATIMPLLKRDGTTSVKTFQLTSTQTIHQNDIVVRKEDRIVRCPSCNQVKIIQGSSYHMYLKYSKLDNSVDFYMTEAIFGDGIAIRDYLLSQRFYQHLKNNGLLHDVNIMPVFSNEEMECIEATASCT